MREWISSRLADLVEFEKGRQAKTFDHPGPGLLPYIGAAALEGDISVYADPADGVLASESDVLMLWDGERSGLVGRGLRGVVGSTVCRLRPMPGIDATYLFWLLSWHFNWIQARRTGTGVPHVPADIGDSLVLTRPADIGEQRCIAEILDTIDEAIRRTERIIAKLDGMKPGLLRDLLTRGVDENGEVRAPDFNSSQYKDSPLGRIPKSWEIKSLDDMVINHDHRRIPIKQSERAKRRGPFPYYGASGIIDWIDAYIFDGEFVLLAEDGENILSRRLPLAFRVSGQFWVNNHAHVLEPRPGINPQFLVELLEATDYSKLVSGSAQPKLTQASLRLLRFTVPGAGEQERIVAVLSAYADRLAREREFLAKLRSLKQGLMDDLLMGRVRVPVPAGSEATVG